MMSFPKPEKRKHVKARADRDHATARRRCVVTVWRRAQGRCERCGIRVRDKTDAYPHEDDFGQVNETTPKSLGGDDTDPAQCELVCRKCHFGGPSGAHAPTAARMRKQPR